MAGLPVTAMLGLASALAVAALMSVSLFSASSAKVTRTLRVSPPSVCNSS